MANPPIEIAWGGDWVASQRRALQPHIQAATEMASEGLEAFDITYRQPKTLTVWRAANNVDVAGGCDGPWSIELYIKVNDAKRRKVARNAGVYSSTILHELVHSVWEERHPDIDIVDRAVNEGVAYFTEDRFARVGLLPEEHEVVGLDIHEDIARHEDQLRAELFKLADAEMHGELSQPALDSLYDQWLERYKGCRLGRAEGLGALCVQRLFLQGAPIAKIIRMPSREVFAVV